MLQLSADEKNKRETTEVAIDEKECEKEVGTIV